MIKTDNITISSIKALDYKYVSDDTLMAATALTTDQIASLTIGNISSINYSTTASPYTFSGNIGYGTISAASAPPNFHCDSDATFNGDIKWKGRSLGDMIEKIEKRLSILTPDPAKLEHFEALRKAYDHYKMLEKLCDLPTTEDGKQ